MHAGFRFFEKVIFHPRPARHRGPVHRLARDEAAVFRFDADDAIHARNFNYNFRADKWHPFSTFRCGEKRLLPLRDSIPKMRRLNSPFGIIAGSGAYPLTLAREARAAGVARIVAMAFQNETDPALASLVDEIETMRVGQLGRMISFLKNRGAREAVMAGQIHPKNLFDLRPDMKALVLLAKLPRRNAESIFGAIGDELAKNGVTLLPATTFMENHLAPRGHIAGPRLSRREEADVRYGFEIAKETSRLDIGQTVVVKDGTVLAVEAFEGTNETIKRGGALGRGDAVVVKVSKPQQDFRFDVPVIGPHTLETARDAKIRVIGIEARKTLLLEEEVLLRAADEARITIFGHESLFKPPTHEQNQSRHRRPRPHR